MNILTNVNVAASAVTLWSAKVDDLSALLVTVNQISGSTITVESSADNSSWAAIPYGQLINSSGVTDFTNGQITAVGRYVFPINAAYVRVRVSAYVGPGNVDVTVDTSTQSIYTPLFQLQNGLTATGTNAATARPLQAIFNRFTTVAAGTGCILPSGLPALAEIVVRNQGANSLTIYAPPGKQINGGANVVLTTSAVFRLVCDSSGNYWSF